MTSRFATICQASDVKMRLFEHNMRKYTIEGLLIQDNLEGLQRQRYNIYIYERLVKAGCGECFLTGGWSGNMA